jgi:ParB/RepB/Spo0J family partition protein
MADAAPNDARSTRQTHLRTERRERSLQARRLRVEDIRFNPRNLRRDLGDLRELTASIAAHGVLVPVMVEQLPTGMQLIYGHRRLAATRLTHRKTIPALIVREHQPDERLLIGLAENGLHRALDKRDRADAVCELLAVHGYTRTQLAEQLGVSPATVSAWGAATSTVVPDGITPARPKVTAKGIRELLARFDASELAADEVIELLRELVPDSRPAAAEAVDG